MLPVMLDVRDRTCLVVGGGAVGVRKAKAVIDAGGRVRMVTLAAPAESVGEVLIEPYAAKHLDGIRIAFAAADAHTNAIVVEDAQARGVLVNSATDHPTGDFLLPAVARRGPVTIAVATPTPTTAMAIRDQLAAGIDEAVVAWVEAAFALRPACLRLPADHGRQMLRRLGDWSWVERFRRDPAAASRAMAALVRDAEADRMDG